MVSCDTEFEANDDYLEDVEIATRDLGCLQACNDRLADCRAGMDKKEKVMLTFMNICYVDAREDRQPLK